MNRCWIGTYIHIQWMNPYIHTWIRTYITYPHGTHGNESQWAAINTYALAAIYLHILLAIYTAKAGRPTGELLHSATRWLRTLYTKQQSNREHCTAHRTHNIGRISFVIVVHNLITNVRDVEGVNVSNSEPNYSGHDSETHEVSVHIHRHQSILMYTGTRL